MKIKIDHPASEYLRPEKKFSIPVLCLFICGAHSGHGQERICPDRVFDDPLPED